MSTAWLLVAVFVAVVALWDHWIFEVALYGLYALVVVAGFAAIALVIALQAWMFYDALF